MSRERLCPFAERYPQPPQPLSAPFGPGVLPLAMDGNLIRDFYFDFKDGRIVDVHLPPALHSLAVPRDAAHGENSVPQSVHSLLPLLTREHLLRPVEYLPNIPTEEIFTSPRWDGVDGRVYSTLPLAMDGNLKIASHKASTASSPFLPGNTFSAQAGVGWAPTHHWKRLAIMASK